MYSSKSPKKRVNQTTHRYRQRWTLYISFSHLFHPEVAAKKKESQGANWRGVAHHEIGRCPRHLTCESEHHTHARAHAPHEGNKKIKKRTTTEGGRHAVVTGDSVTGQIGSSKSISLINRPQQHKGRPKLPPAVTSRQSIKTK